MGAEGGGGGGRGEGEGSGPDIILSHPPGPAGLDFSAPSLPSPTPGPQILSWGPQGRTALSRPQCVCGLEAGSHSPSSSSGPAGGGPSSPSCSSSFSSSCKTRRGSEPGHDRTGGSLILSLGCLTLGKSDLTPGHTLRSDVPQQQGGQKGVTASVRRGSSGQTVGEGGRGCPGPAWARTAFERVWEDCVRAKVNSR